jgi:hypothetical protein
MKENKISYLLVRKMNFKKKNEEIMLHYKQIDCGHSGYIQDSQIIQAINRTKDEKKFLFLEIITGHSNGTLTLNRIIKTIDDLYVKNIIEYYFCPGNPILTREDLERDHFWFKDLLPLNVQNNRGCICVFFLTKNQLKESYPSLLNSNTYQTIIM